MKNEQRPKPTTTGKRDEDDRRYPKGPHDYEKMMRHDSFRRVKGRVRQTKWTDQS